jgi:hypothetical protein
LPKGHGTTPTHPTGLISIVFSLKWRLGIVRGEWSRTTPSGNPTSGSD